MLAYACPMRRTSAETKASILAAARELFGSVGYGRTTIRAVAQRANIDPSMVIRYFGSKQRLFSDAAEFDLRLPDLSLAPRERVGSVLAGHFIDRWEADDALVILLRTSVTDDTVADRMRSIFTSQLLPIAEKLHDDQDEAARRASLAASQVLGIALSLYILKFPPLAAMDREEIIEWIGPTLQRYLVG